MGSIAIYISKSLLAQGHWAQVTTKWSLNAFSFLIIVAEVLSSFALTSDLMAAVLSVT